MGKENEFKFHSATVDTKENIQAGFDLDSGNWQAVQNITQYKKNVNYKKKKKHIMVAVKAVIVKWQLFLIL